MKRIAIMQPYFFPYLGYFQLINAVDTFILLDDVQFIKRGWIHRNRIMINGEVTYVTVPCKKASQNKLINETEHDLNDRSRKQLLNKIKFTYQRAPYFKEVYALFKDVIYSSGSMIADIAFQSIRNTMEYLDIKTVLKRSSGSYTNRNLRFAERIMDICNREGAEAYLNPQGGLNLYNKEDFLKNGISLKFLFSHDCIYRRFDKAVQKKLSIIDIMMFNSKEEIHKMLLNYHLK